MTEKYGAYESKEAHEQSVRDSARRGMALFGVIVGVMVVSPLTQNLPAVEAIAIDAGSGVAAYALGMLVINKIVLRPQPPSES